MNIAISLLSGGLVNRGAEHSMLMLAEDLVSLGHQVTVFQAGPKNPKASYNTISISLPIIPTSHKPTTFFGKVFERLYLNHRGILTLIFSLRIKSKLHPFDVIIPTDGFWSVLCARWGRKKSAKIICVGLAGMGWTDKDTLRLAPDIFVALSSTALTWAQQINPHVKSIVLPLQVDVDKFKKSHPFQLPFNQPVVLTVAALTRYKRVDTVIKAMAKISQGILLILGQGEEYDRLQQLAQAVIPNRYLIKTVDFDTLPQIYKTASAFVLASDSQEAFGQVLVEAMAADLPIVTTNDPIRKEIVGEQGIYVNQNDPQALVNGIQTALSQGKTTYDMNRFDRIEIAKQYEQLCQS